MSIAVTGATGQLGQIVVDLLVAQNVPVIALVRNPAKVTAKVTEVRAFDYESPSVDALKGVKTLLLISSNGGNRTAQHTAVVDAAKAAGVSNIAYTSILKASTSKLLLAIDHKATEEYIEASGLNSVSLRNGWYLENWLGTIGGSIHGGGIIGSTRGAKLSPASRRDYAEAAVAVLLKLQNGEAVKKHYELGGAAITLNELAAEVTKHAGKTVAYIDLPTSEYAKKLESFGIPSQFAYGLAQSDEAAADGYLYTESTDISDLIGHPVENWKEVVATHVKKAIGL